MPYRPRFKHFYFSSLSKNYFFIDRFLYNKYCGCYCELCILGRSSEPNWDIKLWSCGKHQQKLVFSENYVVLHIDACWKQANRTIHANVWSHMVFRQCQFFLMLNLWQQFYVPRPGSLEQTLLLWYLRQGKKGTATAWHRWFKAFILSSAWEY